MPAEIQTLEYKDFSLRLFNRSADQKRPLRGQIELTYRCNIRCVHCYTDCMNNPEDIEKEMSTEEILRVVDEIHDAGCLWLCLTGGEIFMRRDFFEIYDYSKAKGFIVTLFTNVTMVTEEIAERLAANPPFEISTSCHGVGETFDRVTQVPGSFEKFDHGIRLLLARGLSLDIKTKAMTLNRGELPRIKEYIESLGLNFRFTTAIQPDLKGNDKTSLYSLTPREIVEIEMGGDGDWDQEERCQQAKEVHSEPTGNLHKCGCGTNSFLIGAHGRLASCVMNRQAEKDLRGMPFQEAAAELFDEIRSLRYEGSTPCRGCQITSLCEKKPGMSVRGREGPEDPVRHFCETAHLKAGRFGLDVRSPFEGA